jgi:cell division septation protein DedD
MIVGDKPPTTNQQPATSNQPAIAPTGTIMVQIAAVSSQDVADILLASLQKKGYSVSVRHEPQDKLLHVQIGPFADRKEAEAMQQRVLADGFNAIVK